MHMNSLLVSVLIFVFLSVATYVLNECFKHYVQNTFNLTAGRLCITGKADSLSA